MKALTQNLVTGLVAATLATYGVGSVLAAPPKPHPVPGGHWHHSAPAHFHHAPPYHPAHHSYHPVVVHHRPGPVVVLGAAAVPYAEPVVDTSNPAPAASIRLVNPVENQRPLRYTVNGGAVRGLCAGRFIDFDQEVVIRFDRGGGAGVARCLLQDGTYRFRPVDGHWNLVRDDDELAGDGQLGDIAANPVPGM